MRIGAGDPRRIGQGHFGEERQHGQRRAQDRGARAVPAGTAGEGFGHLPADAHQRIERGQWLLEDDGDRRAAQRIELPVGRADDFRAGKPGGAAGPQTGGKKAGGSEGRQRLARARFADEAEAGRPFRARS